jgi:5-methyltetrahydrofolate--homocysteine methyltransferase
MVEEIHGAYLQAGADIIETNSFSSTRIAQADYQLESVVYELNVAAAQVARRAADAWTAKTPARPRLVAGAMGPTNKTLSLSPKVTDPGFRAVTFDEMRDAYAEQVRGLIDGGCDLLLAETAIDTLSLKSCLCAIEDVFAEKKQRLPVMVSGTITDKSGRILSGKRWMPSTRQSRTPGRCQWDSTAAVAPRRSVPTWSSCRTWSKGTSAATPTPACPTPWAATTKTRT